MSFPVPLNNLIGPGLVLMLVGGAITLAFVAGIYSAYLKRQQDAWVKQR